MSSDRLPSPLVLGIDSGRVLLREKRLRCSCVAQAQTHLVNGCLLSLCFKRLFIFGIKGVIVQGFIKFFVCVCAVFILFVIIIFSVIFIIFIMFSSSIILFVYCFAMYLFDHEGNLSFSLSLIISCLFYLFLFTFIANILASSSA